MEITVQDLVGQSSQVYEEGLLFDPNFYKKAITKDRYEDLVTSKELFQGKAVEGYVGFAKTIASAFVAWSAIRSFPLGDVADAGYRLSAFGVAFLAGIINVIAKEHIAYLTGEENKDDYFTKLKQKMNLFACLPKDEKVSLYLRKLLEIGVIFGLGAIVTAEQLFENKIIGYGAIVYSGHEFGQKVASFAIAALKSYSFYPKKEPKTA